MEYDPHRPKWQQIAETLRARIERGDYGPHHLLSEMQLGPEFGVNRKTLRKAIGELREQGLITTQPGMGSFVADRSAGESPQQSGGQSAP
ncbi:GntR family transcriptional regulator [Streptomyces sp. NPDC092296]|uniref:GntR family transcriptional regulator n=1 Tax=Streptomyces sp. NPDC092296 TaxID=3366012 RepID=UPI00382FB0CF